MSSNSEESLIYDNSHNYAFGTSTRHLTKFIRKIINFNIRLWEEINAMEQVFIKLPNIYTFTCQLLFFTMCELAFLTDITVGVQKQKTVTGLTTLLMYSVLGYFTSKVRDIYNKGLSDRSRRTRIGFREYTKCICKILLEWAKAIVVVICLREQGIKYTPHFHYTLITLTYYICTEKVIKELLPDCVAYFKFDIFDSLEHLYIPIILLSYTILSSSVISAYLIMTTPYTLFTVMSSYFTLYIRIKDLTINYIKVLLLERKLYASFKTASSKEIREWDDICAVCLNRMSRARITPCKHLFHPQCLKLCLQTSFQCPLCKQNFV